MLSNLKEAIGKDRHLRNKHTMALSRERMPVSVGVHGVPIVLLW